MIRIRQRGLLVKGGGFSFVADIIVDVVRVPIAAGPAGLSSILLGGCETGAVPTATIGAEILPFISRFIELG